MDYRDSVEQAAEYIRLALPLMARNGIPAHPKHYAVWYNYVSGRNLALKASVDHALADEQALSSRFSDELYDTYFRSHQEQLADQMRQGLQTLLSDAVQQLVTSGGQTQHYGEFLSSYQQRLDQPLTQGELRRLVHDSLAETKTMLAANQQLTQQLRQTQQELDNLRLQLEQTRPAASNDALTGLANRTAFDLALPEAIATAQAEQQPLALILADIDHFKHFNERHGHLMGDKLLRFIASILKDAVKGQDCVARFGGEEFAILLPNTPLRGGLAVAESLRAQVQHQRLKRTDTQQSMGGVTLSLGVACLHPQDNSDALIARAEAAMSHAKRLGRNRVTLETQVADLCG